MVQQRRTGAWRAQVTVRTSEMRAKSMVQASVSLFGVFIDSTRQISRMKQCESQGKNKRQCFVVLMLFHPIDIIF
jgi:hypothetical protein